MKGLLNKPQGIFPLMRVIMIAATSVTTLLAMVASLSIPVEAATATAQYTGVPGTGTRISVTPPDPAKRTMHSSQHTTRFVPLASPTPAQASPVSVTDSPLAHEGSLLHNFNGLSDADSAAVNKGADTPPDQGLCVGNDPGVSGTVVFEFVNSVVRETAPDGSALSGTPLLKNLDFSLAGFFEPTAFSDPRCFYDQSTKSFYFTVLGTMLSGPDAGQSSVDIAVLNSKGFAVFQFDTSFGGSALGDQPHVGYDNNNLYVSTDEFTKNAYAGAILLAISKSQLVAEQPNPSAVAFGPLSLGGMPVLTLQPAVSTTSTGTEYLLNSFPILNEAFLPNPLSHHLGFWTVENGEAVTTGGTVKLTSKIIESELYANPVMARSTGSGTTTNGITSEAALNAGDDRLQQVQFIDGHLWAALTTAVSTHSDPVLRDGVAWFRVDPQQAKVVSQGYVASPGQYLIYPAIMQTTEGTTSIVFTATSPSLNPSAAYVVHKSDAKQFGNVHIAAEGTGPHLSFSDTQDGKRPRWGDYSAATLDLNGKDIWLATEYIPPVANQNPLDNWGTRVFATHGDE